MFTSPKKITIRELQASDAPQQLVEFFKKEWGNSTYLANVFNLLKENGYNGWAMHVALNFKFY